MKLNNKGFAISSIMYIILVFAIILIALTLAVFSSRKLILDKQKNEVLHEIYQTRYKNGDIVYFDVEKGVGCSKEEYNETNSNTGYNGFNNKVSITDTSLIEKLENQNGCLKFYVFNDNGGDTVNLLLDHNTTAAVAWINQLDYNDDTNWGNGITNNKGPLTLLKQLNKDTQQWKGTITPLTYIVDQTLSTNMSNYVIYYNNYKARLITAEEVSQITGNETFNTATTTSDGYFYFDSNTAIQSDTCKNGDTSGCNYGWLYDRTSMNCKKYGCLNNSDSEVYTYWTVTSVAGENSRAWFVDYHAFLDDGYTISDSYFGVRPVITVLRENIL